MTTDPHPTRTLALRGAFWAVTSGLARYAVSGITTLALVRLLSPDDFGLMALTLAAHEWIAHIVPSGFHDAVIQRDDLRPADLNAALWSILAVSGTSALLVVGLALPVADWFDRPALAGLLAAMALAALLRAASAVPRALLNRYLNFRALALARVTGMIAGSAGAVALAGLGAGAWSLVARLALTYLVAGALAWRVAGWRPGRVSTRPAWRDLWAFAPSVSVFTLLAYIVAQADDQLIGFHLGAAALGTYAIAYSFMAWPVRDVLGSAAGVLFPVFARLQNNPERLRATYLAGVQLAAVIVFPALTLIAVAAPVLIPWLLGPEWQPAVLPAQILACGGLREATAMLNGPVFRARGRPGLHTLFQACGTACYLVAFWVGLDFGSAGVAFFYVLTGLLLWPVSLWLVLGVLGESFGRWWHALAPVGAATGIMAVASAIVLHLTRQSWGVGSLVMLLLTGMVAGVVYLGVLGLLVPDFLLWVASLFWEVVAGWAAVE